MRACNEPQKMCTKRDFADARPRAARPERRGLPGRRPFWSQNPFREGSRRGFPRSHPSLNGFRDHPRCGMGEPRRALAGRSAGARRPHARPTCGQPHETCTNRPWSASGCNPRARRVCDAPPTRMPGDLWRFRKANVQVGEPWAAGSMGTPAHRPLSAALPWVGSAFEPSRHGRSEDLRASRPGRLCAAASLRIRRGPSTPGASRPPLRMTIVPAGALPRRRRPLRPARSFDSGGCAASAQDDKMPGAPRPALRMTIGAGAGAPAAASRSHIAPRGYSTTISWVLRVKGSKPASVSTPQSSRRMPNSPGR